VEDIYIINNILVKEAKMRHASSFRT